MTRTQITAEVADVMGVELLSIQEDPHCVTIVVRAVGPGAVERLVAELARSRAAGIQMVVCRDRGNGAFDRSEVP